MEKRYSAKIAEFNSITGKQLTAKEKIMFKDVSDTIPLGELKEGEQIVFKPEMYGVLEIHNEDSENKDYKVIVIIDTDGKKYTTSSENFYDTFINLMDELADCGEDEDYAIKVFTKPSKNYKGKEFLTCAVI